MLEPAARGGGSEPTVETRPKSQGTFADLPRVTDLCFSCETSPNLDNALRPDGKRSNGLLQLRRSTIDQSPMNRQALTMFSLFKKNSAPVTAKQRRKKALAILHAAQDSADFSTLESRIRAVCLFQPFYAENERLDPLRLLQNSTETTELFLFHGDGFIREAAVKRLDGPLSCPGTVFCLFWRLNDWALPVQKAAHDALERCLPETPVTHIKTALDALLPIAASWGRWTERGPKALEATLTQPDVASLILDDLLRTRKPKLGTIFRALCKSPWIDQHLFEIASNAPLPHIRTIAVNAILTQTVVWPSGKKQKIWIDKSMGQYRFEPVFHSRPLTAEIDRARLLVASSHDKSSMVRRSVADALIALRHDVSLEKQIEDIASKLESDTNIGVRRRVEFLRRAHPAEEEGPT